MNDSTTEKRTTANAARQAAIELALAKLRFPVNWEAPPGLVQAYRSGAVLLNHDEVDRARRGVLEGAIDPAATLAWLEELEAAHADFYEDTTKRALRRVGRFLVRAGYAQLWERFFARDRDFFGLGQFQVAADEDERREPNEAYVFLGED